MTPIKLVAFDLDGTLVDSALDIARAVDKALLELGERTYGVDHIKGWVGEGLTKLLKRALTGDVDGNPDPALVTKAREMFREHYLAGLCVDTRFYPGVREALDALEGGHRLACITNKSMVYTEPLLKTLGVWERFEIVVAGDTVPALKPDPRPLLYASDKIGVPPAACCMVGDSRYDILAARAAGFRAVAVSYGYNQGADLRTLGAETELDSLAELPGWIAGLAPAAATR
ncbi:MAG TPA: phosphoglycolate phosphatase [Gammaproteobacteria bacterium]|nr:phosphoglycolate phosphatase [Gammaproteobacteria bacterium]